MRFIQIVEFNGLPGCGKTTLCDEIIRVQDKNKRITYFSDACRKIKDIPFFYRIRIFPFKACAIVFCLFLASPPLPLREFRIYKSMLSFIINYRMVHYLQIYDVLLEDHGIVQRIVSFFYKREKYYRPFHAKMVQKIYDELKPARIIYCDLSAELALLRMNKRNRSGGRIDRIKDHNEQLKALEDQSQFFKNLILDLDLFHKDEFRCLDMEKTTQQLVNDYLQN